MVSSILTDSIIIIPIMGADTEPQIEVDFSIVDLYSIDLRTARLAVKTIASKRLVDGNVSIYHDGLKAEITFTKRGIKECINQPFASYIEKLILIREGLEEAIRSSVYDNSPEVSDKGKEHVVCYHYLEFMMDGKPAFFNIQQTKKGEYVLYTITDNRRRT